ncbi:uncharacterized protein LY89DRAFT_718060 [Mollisia scopiformis]|uniref:Uncharacterized protein n=1 Tax=Mollisia scopiformis TaxID=149040 RepID=A0A194XAZ0_MOLSC|nr:uncharacterized protein LY89DRAFT_718060 [Mollisia scopiformis]KUJ17343.1 hypothetical protein LY89DRAFT_718060 [Mollisia scopiformis]
MSIKEGVTEMGEVSCQWNFVNVISHPRELKQAANISTIRRTAMRAIHRIKRQNEANQTLAQTKVAAASRLDPEKDDAESQHDSTLLSSPQEEPNPSRAMLVVPTRVDVGLCYPAHVEYPNQEYLLNHLHLDMIYKRQPSRLTLQFGIEAARLMSLRLDSRDLHLKDTTIAAVVMMLANQILSGDVVEMVMHLNALERMIEMKGGLDMLGMDGVLQMSLKWSSTLTVCLNNLSNYILRVDVPIAMFQDNRPRSLRSASIMCLEDLITSNPSATVFPSSFDLQKLSQTDIATGLSHLRKEIKNLTETRSRLMAHPFHTSTTESMKFAARRRIIEQMLLLAGRGFSMMHGPDKDARLREASCIAGSIYVRTVLQGFQARPSVGQKNLTRRLMTCVERFELEDRGKTGAESTSIAALFWALNVGGTVSLDLEERTWFILHLSRVVKQLGLRSWGQGLSILNCFLWEEKLETEAWKSISADVQEFIVKG